MPDVALHDDWRVWLCVSCYIFTGVVTSQMLTEGWSNFIWVRRPALIQPLDLVAYWLVSTLWPPGYGFLAESNQRLWKMGPFCAWHSEWRLDFAGFVAQRVMLPAEQRMNFRYGMTVCQFPITGPHRPPSAVLELTISLSCVSLD